MRRDYVAKRNRYMGGGSHDGGGLFYQVWKSWDATVLRRGGERASKRCAHDTNVAEC